MKKKAIKIATASVVAASSFAAVAPFSTEAASSVPSTVAKAVKSMKAAKTAYKSLGDKGKVASVASVQKAVNQAKADYSKAKAALAKYKGKDKSKLNKQLMAAMPAYHNATAYISTVKYAQNIKKQADSFAAAAKAGKSINASDYAKFKAELAKATKKVMDQIVGLADKAVVKAYITPALAAQKTVDSYLVSVKSVDAVAAVTVDEGSKLEDVNLPKEVTVTLVNGKKAQKAVTWDTKELEANLSKPGDYTVKGAVAGTKLEASVKVTVNVVNPKVESVSAIAAKTLKVEFNKAVDDTKATFEVKKAGITANVSKVTFSEDKKSATLELTSKLTEGEYNVTVTGLTETALTGSVKVENEKVTKVDITSELAVKAGDDLKVGYKVYNQYGEDITNSYQVKPISSKGKATADNSTGVVTITDVENSTAVKDSKAGDKISLTLIHESTAITTAKTLTVSDASKVQSLAIKGLYNKDNKTLSEDTKDSEFSLLVDAKDQYGNSLKAADVKDGVVVVSSNSAIVDADNFVDDVDGKKGQLGLKLKTSQATAGKATISIITLATGQVAQYEVEVKQGVAVDSFNMTSPALAVANEKVEIPFTAVDQYGNTVTDVNKLKEVKITATGLTDNDISIEKDKVVLSNVKKEGTIFLVATTKTNKVSTLSVDVKKAAEAKVVTNAKNVPASFTKGATKTVKASDIVVKDQYGRDMKLDADFFKNYKIEVKSSDKNTLTVGGNDSSTINGAEGTVTLQGVAKGDAKVTFAILNTTDNTPVQGSAFEQSLKVVDKADVSKYEVSDVNTIYAEVREGAVTGTPEGYESDLEVYGVDASGKKVLLSDSLYTVVTPKGLDYDNGVLKATSDFTFAKDATEAKVKITVVVDGANGPVSIQKEVTVSNVAPKTQELKLDKNATGFTVADNLVTIATVDNGTVTATTLAPVIKVVDQYGVEDTAQAADMKITFTNVKDAEGKDKDTKETLTSNGKADATLSGLASGDTFVATLFVDGKSLSVKFKVGDVSKKQSVDKGTTVAESIN